MIQLCVNEGFVLYAGCSTNSIGTMQDLSRTKAYLRKNILKNSIDGLCIRVLIEIRSNHLEKIDRSLFYLVEKNIFMQYFFLVIAI
jgi:hypothetical protein